MQKNINLIETTQNATLDAYELFVLMMSMLETIYALISSFITRKDYVIVIIAAIKKDDK